MVSFLTFCSILYMRHGENVSFIYIRSFFIPATTANDIRLRRISIPDFIHYILCPIFILQKEPVFLFLVLPAKTRELVFPFQCSVLNKGTTGTISITSMVWRGPWLGIEPGTSRALPLGYRGGGVIRRSNAMFMMVNTSWCIIYHVHSG